MRSKGSVSLATGWITGVAVLFAITNAHAHLHLCFDGQEPPAAVHIVDSDAHHAHEPDKGHDDVDVDLEAKALSKSLKYDLVAIDSHVLWTLALVEPGTSATPRLTDVPPRPPPSHLRPPLRAPPG